MFQDLDATLEALVEGELSLPGITISFASPGRPVPAVGVTLPAVAFFLYDVRENHELRTNQWENERQRADGVRHPDPRRRCGSTAPT